MVTDRNRQVNNNLPLFRQFPALETLPNISLCHFPTPVDVLDATRLSDQPGSWPASLHIKRDDLSAADYGGNKIRKLEFLLAQAQQSGCSKVLTFGFAGSNFAAATAWHARKQNIGCISMLLPQPGADYLKKNLLIQLNAGAELHLQQSPLRLGIDSIWQMMLHTVRDRSLPLWIPAGGSNAVGVMGFVNAALELVEQCQSSALPLPDRIYLAMGSMGSAVGLALGLELIGAPTQVIAARVVDSQFASQKKATALISQCCKLLSRNGVQPPRVEDVMARILIRDEFFGQGYGHSDARTTEAIDVFQSLYGTQLDPTYSGKAAACLISDIRSGQLKDKHVLYWHTSNSSDLAPLCVEQDWRRLPQALHHYFDNG